MKRKVNLFVVGAMRSGTTSFVNLLSSHPEIYVPPVKEPHHFIDSLPSNVHRQPHLFDLDDYFRKQFPEPLHIAHITSREAYEKVYSLLGDEKMVYDGSTCYLHAPESARLIYEYNPEARIVILLRDPLPRAFSHYNMTAGLGREKRSFENAIRDELKALKADSLEWNSYVGMSLYDEAVQRFTALFENVLVLSLDELTTDLPQATDKLSDFLEIAPFQAPRFKHINAARRLRFHSQLSGLMKSKAKDYFSSLFGKKFKRWLYRKISVKIPSGMPCSEECQEKLRALFKERSSLYSSDT